MRRRTFSIVIACLILAAIAWGVIQYWRGPLLQGYEITTQTIVQTVVATGRVAAVSRAQVGSEITGVVVERRVREGDKVQPGDVLAVLRSDDLAAAVQEAQAALAQLQQSTRPQAQAALQEAEANLTQARREAQRRKSLFERRAIAREDMEQAIQAETTARTAAERARLVLRSLQAGHADEAAAVARLASAQAQLAKTVIRSEVAGTVLTRNAEPGDLVQPTAILFEIAPHDDTEIVVPVDEKNLEVLALGQKAICIADAFPNNPFEAALTFIAPSIDPQRGTIEIRLTATPLPEFLRQDMTVTVNVETGRRDNAVVVPNDALRRMHGHQARVWVVHNGRVQSRQIQLGLKGLTRTEVTAGLESGDLVLADAQAAVTEGDRVRLALGPIPLEGQDAGTRHELPFALD